MGHLVNRSRRNRQSGRVNRNRSRRQIRNQRGGNNVEVLIYCNLTSSYHDATTTLTRKLTPSELFDVRAYVEETFEIFRDPIWASVGVANMLKAIKNKYGTIIVEQLSSPYKNKFHFVIKFSMSKTDAQKLVNQQIVNNLLEDMGNVLEDMGQETIRFEQGNLLSNDLQTYYFDNAGELVVVG
jgi:hypothetical protein